MESSKNVIDIDKLLDKLKEKVTEIKEIYDALKSIRKITGASFDLPDINSLFSVNSTSENVDSSGKIQIKHDQFFRKSQTKAAKEYLSMVGHAMHLTDIYNALKEGGVAFGSEGKKVLYTQVGRASKTFVKVKGDGMNTTFGLVKWYPTRQADDKELSPRPRAKRTRGTGEGNLTQPEGQVQAAPDESKNDDDAQGTTTHIPDDK